jgi:hypothetical protein
MKLTQILIRSVIDIDQRDYLSVKQMILIQ